LNLYSVHLLQILIAPEDAGCSKPAPGGIFMALDKLGITDVKRVLYVGDAETDVRVAKKFPIILILI
jgi:phosphoglycolate phosphatase-like HAD superfamily hydrolase